MKTLIEKILQKTDQYEVNTLLSALGILGNISSTQKMTTKELEKMYIALEPLIDCDYEDITNEVIRLISNQVGVGKEWEENKY